MKPKAGRALKNAFTVALSLLAVPIAAKQGEQTLLEETIVRGSYLQSSEANALKTPTPILDVPQSLSIVTAEEILKRGFTSVSDIIEYMPGVSMSQGEGHRDAVVFRGVRSTADFFIDGVRDDVQYYRPLYNLEQLEVLRGPNALLFGRGGTGGILNRVTKKAEVGTSFTQLTGFADSFGAGGVQGDINFGLGDRVAFRLNAMAEGWTIIVIISTASVSVSTRHCEFLCLSKPSSICHTSILITSDLLIGGSPQAVMERRWNGWIRSCLVIPTSIKRP